jgi:hypothetical protein
MGLTPSFAILRRTLSAAPTPDFDADERGLVAQLLYDRYGHSAAIEDAEADLALDPPSTALTACPTLYWCERGAHFVLSKLAPRRYRGEFFYDDGNHFGTGIERFDDLRRCVTTLLRVQADEERERRRTAS